MAPLTDPDELAAQERAQALAARGDVAGAARLMDAYLAAHDGDWGSWLYLGGLHARLGQAEPAVAAYRACARQLEEEGRLDRARGALQHALRVAPWDDALSADVARLEAARPGLDLLPPPPPVPSVPTPRLAAVVPQVTVKVEPAPSPRRAAGQGTRMVKVAQPAPRRAAARLGRSMARRLMPWLSEGADEPAAPGPSLPEAQGRDAASTLDTGEEPTTDPYLAIFDILDAEQRSRVMRSARRRSIRTDETTPTLPPVGAPWALDPA